MNLSFKFWNRTPQETEIQGFFLTPNTHHPWTQENKIKMKDQAVAPVNALLVYKKNYFIL